MVETTDRTTLRTLVAAASVGAAGLTLVSAPVYAAGADQVRASAARADGATIEVFAVITPGGTAHGRAAYGTAVLGDRTGRLTCGSVDGSTAVVGGYDDTGAAFTIAISDEPDGFILGHDRPPCDTTGFGDPGSLPIATGDIRIIDR